MALHLEDPQSADKKQKAVTQLRDSLLYLGCGRLEEVLIGAHLLYERVYLIPYLLAKCCAYDLDDLACGDSAYGATCAQ